MDDITIIINSYKPKKKDLLRSIDSCLKQKNVNVKILVSTIEDDPTILFVNELNNEKIKLVISTLTEHPGRGAKGIYFQLNKALLEVDTDYVTYFSSNDKMLKNKSIDEITKLKNENTIFCFSSYNIYYIRDNYILKHSKIDLKKENMNFKNLLKTNFINDCATINLKKIKKLKFNYKKYENCCFWFLWLTLLKENGINCMSYNENLSWNYLRDVNNSQSLKKNMKNELNIKDYIKCSFLKINTLNNKIPRISQNRIWWYNNIKIKKYYISILVNEKYIFKSIELFEKKFTDFQYEIVCFNNKSPKKLYNKIEENIKYLNNYYKITLINNTEEIIKDFSDELSVVQIKYIDNDNIHLLSDKLEEDFNMNKFFFNAAPDYLKAIIDYLTTVSSS